MLLGRRDGGCGWVRGGNCDHRGVTRRGGVSMVVKLPVGAAESRWRSHGWACRGGVWLLCACQVIVNRRLGGPWMAVVGGCVGGIATIGL